MLPETRLVRGFGNDTYSFTPRQMEILKLLIKGKKNQEIAAELFIQIGSVKFHVTNLIKEFGVTSRAEIMAKYFAMKEAGYDLLNG